MDGKLEFDTRTLEIEWDESCSIIESIKAHPQLKGVANNIQGEVFFYQYELEIPLDQTAKEIFEPGDVVYWRSQTDPMKFGILFMYGNTEYGDGTQPRTSSPGIKIGKIKDYQIVGQISTGTMLSLS